ncbi:hypothetical protein ACA910_018181 [Epithemia clementina (nom. ined.)]
MLTARKSNDEDDSHAVASSSHSSSQPSLLRPRATAAQKRSMAPTNGSRLDDPHIENNECYYLYKEHEHYSVRDSKPPPVYHRHYRHDATASVIGSLRPTPSSRGQRPSRLVLFLPLLLFATILGVAFLQPLPPVSQDLPSARSIFSDLQQQSAVAALLHSSRQRRQGENVAVDRKQKHKQKSHPERPKSQPSTRQTKQDEEAEDLKQRDLIEPPRRQQTQEITPTRRHVGRAETFVIELKNDFKSLGVETDNVLTIFTQEGSDNHIDDSEAGTEKSTLRSIAFPYAFENIASKTNGRENTCQSYYPSLFLPINDFPYEDPYLPWIHDYWYVGRENSDWEGGGKIQFVAQNKRRCETGDGKEKIMKHWEPQVALFQSISIAISSDNTTIQLTDSPEDATIPETRLLCHFHSDHGENEQTSKSSSFVTFSEFNFNYEYVLWRKRWKHYKGMFVEKGKDVEQFELSQLIFSCPVPDAVLSTTSDGGSRWFLDLVPIRTRVRRGPDVSFSADQIGPSEYRQLSRQNRVPKELRPMPIRYLIDNSGRWANLPLCFTNILEEKSTKSIQSLPQMANFDKTTLAPKKHNLVVCTWTASNYFRRGDATSIPDPERRLREWILFHQLVGADHIYIYDNSRPTGQNATYTTFVSPLRILVERYFSSELVTYIPWPCQVCSNNRPNHPNPGERSSQYAAEASCRERFGHKTEWMAFIDIDEYLVPMMPKLSASSATDRVTSWTPVLEQKRKQGYHVLKMRSSRGRPRVSLMETIVNDTDHVCREQTKAKSRFPKELCVQPLQSQTFLKVYNCEYIRPPKPERFQRAMKQIYRPAFVLSHYIHYSTITKPMAEYYRDLQQNNGSMSEGIDQRSIQNWEWGDTFLDELQEGCLVHTKSILPHETMFRSSLCKTSSTHVCPVGFECPDSTAFVDKLHTKNIFHDEAGNYCNCWINHHLEDTLIPRLEKELILNQHN